MTPDVDRMVQTMMKGAAELLVKAALMRVRADAPWEGTRYYLDMLEGDYFCDEQFECDFWGMVAAEVARQL